MPALLEQKLYKLCDALGYERRYFKSTIDDVLIFLQQLELDDQQFIHVQAIAFIERVLQNLEAGKQEPGAELKVTVADLREIREGLLRAKVDTATEFKDLFKELQTEVFAVIKDVKAQLQSEIEQHKEAIKTQLQQIITLRKAMIDEAAKGKLSPKELEAEYKKELRYHLHYLQYPEEFLKQKSGEVLLREAKHLDKKVVKEYTYKLAKISIDYDQTAKALDKFSALSTELSADNLELILTKLGARYPELLPKLQRLKELNLYYPMSLLHNFMFHFEVLRPNEENLRVLLELDAVMAVLKEYNEIQNIKAIILAIISLSIKLYIDVPLSNVKAIAIREDLPFVHVVKMEAELLGFIDWRVEVSAEDYDRIRQLLAKEFPNLPSIADVDKAERKQIRAAKKGQDLYREVKADMNKVTSSTSAANVEGSPDRQTSAGYLHAAIAKLRPSQNQSIRPEVVPTPPVASTRTTDNSRKKRG